MCLQFVDMWCFFLHSYTLLSYEYICMTNKKLEMHLSVLSSSWNFPSWAKRVPSQVELSWSILISELKPSWQFLSPNKKPQSNFPILGLYYEYNQLHDNFYEFMYKDNRYFWSWKLDLHNLIIFNFGSLSANFWFRDVWKRSWAWAMVHASLARTRH
jgi:hypothetical protein